MEKKIVKYTEEELKKMKGSTQWATLVKNNKDPDNKIQRTQKTRS